MYQSLMLNKNLLQKKNDEISQALTLMLMNDPN
jgi:hypothetical protein